MSDALATSASVWGRTWLAGLSLLRGAPKVGVKRLILPVSYWRTREFAYAGAQLRLPRGARLLDLGSPKDFASLLARSRGYEVVATDILPKAVADSSEYARALGVEGEGPGRVRSEVQDGRSLTYPEGSFDAAFAISVVEHIPGMGDREAMTELVRVVRPGGRVVVTTPYAANYRETFVRRDVYERERQGDEAVFYERHYDDATLRSRLIEVPGTRLVDLQLWGETYLPVERLLAKSRALRMLCSPLEPPLAMAALRQIRSQGRPMAAFFTLERTAD